MPAVAKIGLVELAVAAWSGWIMVLTVEMPERLKALGVTNMVRIRQAHIDLLMMGTILTALGVALDPMPTWIAAAIVPGALIQPFMFVPRAFREEIREMFSYKAINGVLFAAMTAGWAGVVSEVFSR